MIQEGYQPASVNYYLAQLRAIINYAIDADAIVLKENFFKKVKLLKLNNARQRILSEEEIETLFAALLHNPKAYLFVLVAICTGTRPQYTIAVHEKLQITLYDWIERLAPKEYVFFRGGIMKKKEYHFLTYINIQKKLFMSSITLYMIL